MVRLLPRALATGIVGALAGAVCLTLAFTANPDIALEMDRDLPRLTSGFHPAEITRDDSFAWTGRSAAVRLHGADRSVAWTCAVRVRGGRSAPLEQPVVDISADGITLGGITATNEYQTVEVTVPPQPARAGFVLTIASSSTFVPGPGDRRELGVQVGQLTCRRGAGGIAIPPRRALTAATISGAIFGVAFSLLALPWTGSVGATLLVAMAQAVPLAAGPAPYSPYEDRAGPLAFWIALTAIAAAFAIERSRRQPLSTAARFVVAFSAGALFVELLALLHPMKLVIDALFHAHRLEWVLGGRYYFTQPMPDGVQFPYAIGLYLFAAPWTALTNDHVTLLRTVVCAAHAFAGGLLYWMVASAWRDRTAGAVAVILFHLAPLPYVVIGNANLTYAFGQSAAFVTVAAATVWTLQGRALWQWAALFALASLAFLSHVGVFPVLLTTLVAAAILFRVLGGRALGAPARAIFIVATLAAVFSVASYYGRFAEVYKSLDRVRHRAAAAAAPAVTGTTSTVDAIPLHRRARTVGALVVRAFGWPVVLLAAAGVWQVWRTRARDRLTLVLGALLVTYLLFVGFAAATPVEPRFQKYSDEFIDRVNYATLPLAAVLAGRAVSWAWASGIALRLAAAGLVAGAALIGVRQWLSWLG